MADKVYFPDLSALQTLEMLAAAAGRAGAGQVLPRLDGRYEPAVGTAAPTVTLRLDVSVRRGRGEQEAEKQLVGDYKRLSEKDNALSHDPSDQPYTPLIELLPWLLLGSDAQGDTGPIDEDRRLVIGRNLGGEQAAETLERLNQYAPPLKWAVRDTADGATYHYYLLNDAAAQAAPAWEAGRPAGCSPALQCYYVELRGGRYDVFAPRDAALGRKALDWTVAFLLAGATALGLGRPVSGAEPVLAITRADGETPPQAHYLANLLFADRNALRPLHQELASLEVVVGDGSEAAQRQLQDRMDRMEPKVGYRLELRPAFRRVADEGAYEAAARRRDEANYEMLLIESLRDDPRQPRPTLVRCSTRQLPILADVIRSYRSEDLSLLRYCFQADSSRYPDGAHYLYVDPALVRTERDPLVYWEGHSEAMQPLRFWIDPYWALNYYQGETSAQVFAPYGMVLYPTLHSWRQRDDGHSGGDTLGMNKYLAQLLLRVREASDDGQAPAPERAVYVFDGKPGRQIELFALDMAAFQPLTARLEWLNDCLSVLGHVGVEEYVREMSEAERRARLAHRFSEAAEDAVTAYTQAQQAAEATMAGYSGELMAALTGELNRLVTRAEQLGRKAGELNGRLMTLEADFAEMNRLTSLTEDLKARALRGAEELDAYSAGLTGKVERSIRNSMATRERLQRQLAEDVAALSETHQALAAKLAELREVLR